MTVRQAELVEELRHDLLRANYPAIYAVDNETLEAVEEYIINWLTEIGRDPILKVGKRGLYFKGVELVLRVE